MVRGGDLGFRVCGMAPERAFRGHLQSLCFMVPVFFCFWRVGASRAALTLQGRGEN
jgi:hypothetical protein